MKNKELRWLTLLLLVFFCSFPSCSQRPLRTQGAQTDELNFDPDRRGDADFYAQILETEWVVLRNPSLIKWTLGQVTEFGPPSHSTEAKLVPILVAILHDARHFDDLSQYLAASQLDDMEIPSATVVAALKECLAHAERELTRLASGVALVKLGYVQEALPVVEYYARTPWHSTDSSAIPGDAYDLNPVGAFLLLPDMRPLRLADPVAEDSLNAYFVRDLSCPDPEDRLDAVYFLLQKGIAMQQALQTAEDLLEHLEPGPYEYAFQHNLVYILDTFGGKAGKAIAAPYRDEDDVKQENYTRGDLPKIPR